MKCAVLLKMHFGLFNACKSTWCILSLYMVGMAYFDQSLAGETIRRTCSKWKQTKWRSKFVISRTHNWVASRGDHFITSVALNMWFGQHGLAVFLVGCKHKISTFKEIALRQCYIPAISMSVFFPSSQYSLFSHIFFFFFLQINIYLYIYIFLDKHVEEFSLM